MRKKVNVHILVTGGNSGLGRCLMMTLQSYGHLAVSYDVQKGLDVMNPDVDWIRDVMNDRVDVLINNAGVNRINWLEDVAEVEWDHVLGVNAKGIFKMTQALLPLLIESRGTVLNIVSNAAHMPMRCSLAYNASKGAAHIMTQQLARELTPRYGITVFGVAPNRLAGTEMSASIDEQVVATRGWTIEQTRDYQAKALLTGEETPPALVAEFIAYLLQDKEQHKYLTGCVLPYGA